MKYCEKKSYNKKYKKCGCNNNVSTCGCNNTTTNNCSECNKYKELANEKCEQANCLINKAERAAQAAKAAERRAEELKYQAIQECEKANGYWAEYKNLSGQGSGLMQQAQDCLAKAAECFDDCYEDDFGCNLDDFGYNSNSNCNCGCNCNKGCW